MLKKKQNMNTDITKELILDNFANKTTPLQRKQIDNWLQNTSNEELYYKWLEEWENSNFEYYPDSQVLTERFKNFLNINSEAPIVRQPSKILGRKSIIVKWSIAASILLFLSIGLWLFQDSIIYTTYRTAYGEVKSFVLIDGTQVTLNANSSFKVPRWGFGDSKREVYLTGEADFSVTHSSTNQKFIVKTDKNFEVVVLGTEFSVFARPRGANIVLKKGKVLVNYKEGKIAKRLIMKPGELVTFNKNNQALLKPVIQPSNFSLWKEKRFVFEETQLSDVAQMLEETYGLKVTINNRELAERKIMGSFRAENVDELLYTISELLDINVIRQEDKVQLSEK